MAASSPEESTGPRTQKPPPIRIGHGYDLHRLEPTAPDGPGRPLIIGGVRLDHDKGPVARSDGDVLMHAVTDAILGALALPDIGELFPDTEGSNENRDSAEFLAEAVRLSAERGYTPVNLDATIVLEHPRLKPVKAEIRESLAGVLDLPFGCVNVKGKTHERVDAVGEGRAVEAHAVVLMRHGGL